MRVGDVVDAAAAVHERVDEEVTVVGGEADVDRQERLLLRLADVATAVAANVPSSFCSTSHIFAVSADVVKA